MGQSNDLSFGPELSMVFSPGLSPNKPNPPIQHYSPTLHERIFFQETHLLAGAKAEAEARAARRRVCFIMVTVCVCIERYVLNDFPAAE